MPGILPMKVIKVGTSAQARIAQACDRCRSKKIRCDGVRPCCSQCANVGFECKTSDKLSRRAFPRGYTESLEERVRSLEGEVRELKDLLDEKDEKIDMLSRIHSQSSQPVHLPSPRRASSTSVDSGSRHGIAIDKDEMFKVQQSPHLLSEDGNDSYFSGTSSGRTFVEAFKQKAQESGMTTQDISADKLLASSVTKMDSTPMTPDSPVVWKAPPRLVSDQLINKYFQEWAPLFPVLHRPSFLSLYERYIDDSDEVTDKAEIAQLNLVFGIASLSTGTRSSSDLASFESQWRAAVDCVLTENSMSTLQCLVLAQMYCIQQADLTRLLTYKGLSTTLSARLGLHQSQKRFALGTLTCETRKKVFWTLYTVDSFSAVVLGLPKHIKDEDVHCEYPVDADDEYVTEGGFQPTLPGESTKLSSALALFRVSRVLSKVLEEVFPAKTCYELSLKKLSELSDELDCWSNSLAPHLRLQFAQDKPSTGVISSRSPILSLVYHYIRALIQRPAICSSTLGSRSHSSMLALAGSAKHIIQIIQLLEERGMSFSFCLNLDEILVLSGLGLLFQRVQLDSNSKMLKDNQKMVCAVIEILDKSQAPCAPEFRRVACSFLPTGAQQQTPVPTSMTARPVPKQKLPPLSRHISDPTTSAATVNQCVQSSTKKQLKAIASRFTVSNGVRPPRMDPLGVDGRRATVPNISLHPNAPYTQSQPSLQPTSSYNPASVSRSEPAHSPVNTYSQPLQRVRPGSTTASMVNSRASAPTVQLPAKTSKRSPPLKNLPNLDYLSFGNEDTTDNATDTRTSQSAARGQAQPEVKTESDQTDWEKLLSSLDNGNTNIFDACYGGRPVEALMDAPPRPGLTNQYHTSKTSLPVSASSSMFSNSLGNDHWGAADLWTMCHTDTHDSAISNFTTASAAGGGPGITIDHADRTGSLSTDSLNGSHDEFSNADWLSAVNASDAYKGIIMPAESEIDFGSAWDATLNLE